MMHRTLQRAADASFTQFRFTRVRHVLTQCLWPLESIPLEKMLLPSCDQRVWCHKKIAAMAAAAEAEAAPAAAAEEATAQEALQQLENDLFASPARAPNALPVGLPVLRRSETASSASRARPHPAARRAAAAQKASPPIAVAHATPVHVQHAIPIYPCRPMPMSMVSLQQAHQQLIVPMCRDMRTLGRLPLACASPPSPVPCRLV